MTSRSCAVTSCEVKRNDASHTLHKIPSEIALRRRWFSAIGISSTKIELINIFVCSKHFKKGDFIRHRKGNSKRRRLKKEAVPSLYLTQKFYKTKNVTDRRLTIVLEEDQSLEESCQSSDSDFMGSACSNLIGGKTVTKTTAIEESPVTKTPESCNSSDSDFIESKSSTAINKSPSTQKLQIAVRRTSRELLACAATGSSHSSDSDFTAPVRRLSGNTKSPVFKTPLKLKEPRRTLPDQFESPVTKRRKGDCDDFSITSSLSTIEPLSNVETSLCSEDATNGRQIDESRTILVFQHLLRKEFSKCELQKKEHNSQNISEPTNQPECKKQRRNSLVTRPNSGTNPTRDLNHRHIPINENLNSRSDASCVLSSRHSNFNDKVTCNSRGTEEGDWSVDLGFPQENQHTHSSTPKYRVALSSEKENSPAAQSASNSLQSCQNQIHQKSSSDVGKRRKGTSNSADSPAQMLDVNRASTEQPSVNEYQAWCEFATAALQKMDAARARELMTLFTKHLMSPQLHKKKPVACEQADNLETEEALDQEAKEQIEKITLLKMEIESLQVEHNAKMAMYDKQFPCPAETVLTVEITKGDAQTAEHV